LLNSAAFTGTITGFTGSGTGTPATSDKLDLRDINFSSTKFAKSYAGNVLTVTDGTHTANISMVGTYTLASFHFAGDGSGGTLVTDPPSEGVVNGSLSSSGENAALSGLWLPDPGPATGIGDFAALKSLGDQSNSPVGPLSDESGSSGTCVHDIAFSGINLGESATVADGFAGELADWFSQHNACGSAGGNASVADRAVALLGQYMASSFATANEGYGATPFTDPPPDHQQHLSLPHAA
jgi:hypothetical protein